MNRTIRLSTLAIALVGSAAAGAANASTLVATYQFQGTLNADQAGVVALAAVDPLGTSGFVTDTVFGQTRQVYAFNGNQAGAEQSGLVFDNSAGLLTANDYSVETILQFNEHDGDWRRILDVMNRQSDSGFYVDPINHLDQYPIANGGLFTNDVYHHVVVTQSAGGEITAYLDGALAFSVVSSDLTIGNPEHLLTFFLDNVVGAGLDEYSKGRVGLIRLYDGVLTDDEVAALARDPFPAAAVPEPGTLTAGLMGAMLAFGGSRLVRRRRNS